MKCVKLLMAMGWIAAFFCTANLSAEFDSVTELELSGGWRRDNFRSHIVASDGATDSVSARCLDIWQVGFRGRWEPTFDCNDFWIDNLFARGSAYWGTVSEGDYVHRIKSFPVDDAPNPRPFDLTRTLGRIYGGRTWDYKIGVGYLFPITPCLRVGPVAGYSYDKLRFKASNVFGTSITNVPGTDQYCSSSVDSLACVDEGVRFTSKWRGPWLGVDARFQLCDIDVNAGYEYHWSYWRGAFKLAGPDLQDCFHYSDKRKSYKAYGHEVFVNAHYVVDCFWTVGVGVEYKYYRQPRSSRFKPSDASLEEVGCLSTEVNNFRSNWRPFAVTFDVGYLF